MKLGQIIKKYRVSHDMSMDDFAKVSGISKTYISMLENGINKKNGKEIVPTVEYIRKAAKGMFMQFDDLFAMVDGNTQINLDDTIVGKKAIRVPVLGKVAAGIPISAVEDVLDYEEISDTLAHTGTFFALKIKGDSMSPKIENGSVVIVRQQETADNGSIVVALVNGDDAVCKRLVKNKNGIQLVSINPAYDPLFFTNEECDAIPVKIVGKVVEIRTKCE